MNYYIPTNDQALYLYDKVTKEIILKFRNEDTVEEWLVANLWKINDTWYGRATNLTMDIEAPPILIYERRLSFTTGEMLYVETDNIAGYKKHLVIISNFKTPDTYSIYNYTNLINKVKERIINGKYKKDEVYARWWDTNVKNLPEFRKGPVPHTGSRRHNGSSSNLIVNKAERAAYSQPLDGAFYDRETDSFIEYELPRNIKGLRGDRRIMAGDVWEDGYARRSNHDSYKRHCSWKNIKKSRQWM